MTDRYKNIRKALAMGPTPGPWSVRYDYAVQAPAYDDGRLVPVAQPYGVNCDGTDLFANAALIAACNPDTIRELLDERDALAAENSRLRAEVDMLRADLMESDEIREKLGHLLTLTAKALKGEPPAGAASVFWSRAPAPVEVLNDLDDRIVNLFRVLQDREQFEELRHRIMWTPYARAEFGRALDILKAGSDDPVERAWAFFVAQNQGFGGVASVIGNWGRVFVSQGGMADTTNKWIMRQTMMDAWRWRLMRCQIDNRDALEVIRYWDNPEAVFYIDPPYHHDTRKDTAAYAVEQDHDHHVALVEILLGCQGAVVLSGYDHPVYQPLVDAGWEVTRFETSCYAAGRTRGSGLQGRGATKAKVPRTEVVWRNPRAVEMTR